QSIALDPHHGNAEVNGTTITYTPEVDFEGLDEFVYVVNAFGQENIASQGPLTSYGLVTVQVGE
ncbi:MAG TPA: Ig-like domain-containing protein, partial [Cyclobacteriaceae bacterium]|nr:Ig-like domain-containing protein [Cyclobacteriaceae bacterium]